MRMYSEGALFLHQSSEATSVDKFALNFTTFWAHLLIRLCLLCLLWQLSHDVDKWLVAGDAVVGEGELVVAVDCGGVGEFEGDLGEREVGNGNDRFDDERVQV